MKKPPPALVIAALALFAALGGVAYAGQALSTASRVVSVTATVQPGEKGLLTAKCPSRMHASGGGYKTDGVGANDSYPLVSRGVSTGWTLTTHAPKTPKTGTATAGTATVYAVCTT